MRIDGAVEVFVKAFCHLKSRTAPYVLDRTDGLWVMHDPPGKKKPRKTEVVSSGFEPEEAVGRVRAAVSGWHFLCDVHPVEADFEARRRAFKDLGYRAMSRESLFVHDLAAVPEYRSDPDPKPVPDEVTLAGIPQRAGQPRKLQSGTRMYCVWDDTGDKGWVTSVPVGPDAWAADLYVHRPFRGQGYGRALMSRLLLDDKAIGVRNTVLLASSDGARLYPHLGFREIGILQLFCPVER